MAARRILVIGDVMTDISVVLSGPLAVGSDVRATIRLHPGGSAATQAVWLARASLGVDFVGRVGAADHAAQSGLFAREGVTPHLAADAHLETGRLIALIDRSGERSFLTDRGANDALSPTDVPDALIAGADHIHISGYALFAAIPRATVMSVIRRAGEKPISVDPGSAGFLREFGAQRFLDGLAGTKILFPNSEEAETLAGSADPAVQREALTRRFPLVVVKRGVAGAEAWRGDEIFRVSAPAIEVVDTTGAGDAFAGAFLAAVLGDETMPNCLDKAVAAGSAAVGFLGARPPER
jgi:sugar/nucleoside kinase (ribokinase family)